MADLNKSEESDNKIIIFIKEHKISIITIIMLCFGILIFFGSTIQKSGNNSFFEQLVENKEDNINEIYATNNIFCIENLTINEKVIENKIDNNTCSNYTNRYCYNGKVNFNCDICDCSKINDTNIIINEVSQKNIGRDNSDNTESGGEGGAPSAGDAGAGGAATISENQNPIINQTQSLENNTFENSTIPNNITETISQNETINNNTTTNETIEQPQNNQTEENITEPNNPIDCYVENMDSNGLTVFTSSTCHDSSGTYTNLCASPINQDASDIFIKTFICINNRCNQKYYSCQSMGQTYYDSQEYRCINSICTIP